jgi:hypothetical protein
MLIPDAYPRLEKEKGRWLREIDCAGIAFTRKDILDAIESLRGGQVAVLGGDVLKIASGAQPDGLCMENPNPRTITGMRIGGREKISWTT